MTWNEIKKKFPCRYWLIKNLVYDHPRFCEQEKLAKDDAIMILSNEVIRLRASLVSCRRRAKFAAKFVYNSPKTADDSFNTIIKTVDETIKGDVHYDVGGYEF